MTAPQIALVSDDLTGALDSAAPFARTGCRTVVATGLASLDRALRAGADVVAVSLDSREGSVSEAAERARLAAMQLAQVPVVFKKIDSRMKGHIGAETAEIAAVRALRRIMVCPAIPELGRAVIDGCVVGHGIDRPIPVGFATGPAIEAVFPDARTDADLDLIAADAAGALLVGARGLAAALARRAGKATRPAERVPDLLFPVTIAVGSRDVTTLDQVARLRLAHPSALWVAAPDGNARPAGGATGNVTILQAVAGQGTDGATVAARLAESTVSGFLAGRRTLLMTGGETASACLRAMRSGVLLLVGESQAGMPVSLPLDIPDAPHIVTKSGGFGDPDCLVDLVRTLKHQGRK